MRPSRLIALSLATGLLLWGVAAVLPGREKAAARSALFDACASGDVARARAALDQGVNVNGFPLDTNWEEEMTPLGTACMSGHVEVVRLLLNRGADTGENGGWSDPLVLATRHGYSEIVELLLDRGAQVNTPGDVSLALWEAVFNTRNSAMVQLLLRHGADPNTRFMNESVLQVARQNGSTAIVRLLQQAGARG